MGAWLLAEQKRHRCSPLLPAAGQGVLGGGTAAGQGGSSQAQGWG